MGENKGWIAVCKGMHGLMIGLIQRFTPCHLDFRGCHPSLSYACCRHMG